MDRAREIAFAVQKYLAVMKMPHCEEAKTFLQQCQSKTFTLKNKQYTYYQCGDGPTAVLIHGLNSNLGSMVPIAEDLLTLGYKVILFDAPAHGEATGLSTTFAHVRAFLLELGKQLGELEAIVAHSLGGAWALSSWSDQFRAKTLVLMSTPSNHRFMFDKFITKYNIDEAIVEGFLQQIERRFGDNYWAEYSPSNTVKTVDVPGLIIHSRNDEFVPVVHAQQIHSNWHRANIEILDDNEHLNIAELPEVRHLIVDHVQRIN